MRLRPPRVPTDFWRTDEMREALACWHMGKVIRAFRMHPFHGQPISQEVAAGWMNLTQTQLSRIELGPAPDSLTKLTHWAHTFGVPADLLWFQVPGRAVEPGHGQVSYLVEPDAQGVAWQSNPQQHIEVLLTEDVEWPDDMNRRELLRLLTMASAPISSAVTEKVDWERFEHGGDRPRGVDGPTLDEYATLNGHLWRVFVLSKSKKAVFPLVRSHLDALTTSLQRAQPPEVQRLCFLVGDVFQLAGEVCFDANRYTEAAQCYTLAATACKEADAFDLWACALTRHAFIGVYERRFDWALGSSQGERARRPGHDRDTTPRS